VVTVCCSGSGDHILPVLGALPYAASILHVW
jgi:hypothetical protein